MKLRLVLLVLAVVLLAGCRSDDDRPDGPFTFNLDSFPSEFRQSFQDARDWWASDPKYSDQFADSPAAGATISVVFSDSTLPNAAAQFYGNEIAFNQTMVWSTCPAAFPGVNSIYLASAHEIGHVLGFGHNDIENNIMFFGPLQCIQKWSIEYSLP